MIDLIPLCTAVVEVEPTLPVGAGPAGPRSVSALSAVTITGERLKATLAGAAAADWMVRAGSQVGNTHEQSGRHSCCADVRG
jgi:hypothetical protein